MSEKKKVIMSIVGDNIVDCSMSMTIEEYDVIRRFLDTAISDGRFAPSIHLNNPWDEERLALEKLKRDEEKRRNEIIKKEEEHKAYLREHGPFAVAYRNALANKRG